MTKKRRKRSEEEVILFPSEAKIGEITDKKIVEEEVITEERIITGFDSPPHKVFPVEEVEPSISEPIESPPPPTTKKIRYLGVDILIMKGPVTRQRYRFTAKDRISEVAIEDYEGLLKRVRSARKCCGRKAGDPGRTVPSQPYFGPV